MQLQQVLNDGADMARKSPSFGDAQALDLFRDMVPINRRIRCARRSAQSQRLLLGPENKVLLVRRVHDRRRIIRDGLGQ
ncbi:MAG: hypothetical protein M3Y41_07050 [Pseudomonadota bacterium]|nr:hypothetical protein [Pseudomonadota bacterium]